MAVRLAASLGLADARRPVDLWPSHGEGLRRSQTYLVGKLLTARAFNKRSFMGMFRRAWRLNGRYTVQEHDDRFLFTLSDPTDPNRILPGGPWGFDRAPVVLAPYDGVGAIKDVSLIKLAFWIKVRGLPLDFHMDRCLRRVGSALGRFVQKDTTEFAVGRILIRVEVDLMQPIIFRRSFTVDDGIVVDLEFFFENLYGRCRDCGLVTHVGLPCSGTALPVELQTATPVARRNLERALNQVGVIQAAGPNLIFGAQNTPQVGLERFMPNAKPKVRKEIRRRPSVGSGEGSSGVQTASNAPELDGGSEPKSNGSDKGTVGADSSTEHAPNHAMHSPRCGMHRKHVDEDGPSPK
ncbi:uncharacterized protein LOC133711356 [Rosa rugosa]|uniref:uncharacterized protein LOC133711356 n=1 Tax=Rosa rugosa TaxID=74645 RepID=UPI002B4019BD|nr:uncharacterized protein LOC133711356 [Rosa rugosa]